MNKLVKVCSLFYFSTTLTLQARFPFFYCDFFFCGTIRWAKSDQQRQAEIKFIASQDETHSSFTYRMVDINYVTFYPPYITLWVNYSSKYIKLLIFLKRLHTVWKISLRFFIFAENFQIFFQAFKLICIFPETVKLNILKQNFVKQ